MPGYGAVWINGRDLRTLGVITATLDGPYAPPAARYQTSAVRGRYGVVRTIATPDGAPRTLTLTGTIEAASVALADAAYDAVLSWCSRGMLELRSAHTPAKVYYALPLAVGAAPQAPQFLGRYARFTLTLECHDPLAYRVLGRVVRLSANNDPRPIRMPSANAAHVSGVVRAWGPWSNLTLSMLDAAGTVRLALPLSGSNGSSEYTIIDNLTSTIRTVTSGGAPVDAFDLLTATYDFPLVVDPLWADPEHGVYAQIVASGLQAGGGIEFFWRETSR